MADVTIRPLAGFEEIDLLAPLWIALTEHHVGLGVLGAPGRGAEDAWAMRRAFYASVWDRDAVAWIAERDGEPVGYALTWTGSAWSTWAIDRVGKLETLVVLPGVRGEGIGERLARTAIDAMRARGLEHITVTHMEGNDRAAAFYARLGFAPLDRTLHLRG